MLAGAHVTFAQAEGGSAADEPAETMGEDCYWENETVRARIGRLVKTRVQECD